MIRKAVTDDIDRILSLEKEYFSLPRLNIDINDFIVEDNIHGYADMKIVLDEGYIGNLLVVREFRNNGIADNLLLFLDSIAKEKELSFITLEVRESNYPAINLYKKHGYVTEGILKKHFSLPNENGLVMTKRGPF